MTAKTVTLLSTLFFALALLTSIPVWSYSICAISEQVRQACVDVSGVAAEDIPAR